MLRSNPAQIAVTPDSPGTWTGTLCALLSDVPSPNSPEALAPHAQTVPSFFSASECPAPAAMAVMLLTPLIMVGVNRGFGGTLPLSPKPFEPQPQTVPSDFNA